jgi:hypothetical protein
LDLLGTGSALRILLACHRPFVVEAGAILRLPKGMIAKMDFDQAHAMGALRFESLPAAFSGHLVAVAGAPPPDDIGDEEAACISYAYGIEGAAVLDDPKPERIAEKILPGVLHSLDLLSAPSVQENLGNTAVAEALDRARREVRLRVPSRFEEWAARTRALSH